MTARPLSKSEIVAELLEIKAEQRRLGNRETELLTLLQNPKKKGAKKSVPLTFGKDVITWDRGALVIKGKGYKFVKALYDADKMRLKRELLGKVVWNDSLVNRHTFIVLFHWLSEKLEKAKFPYRLIPVKSKSRVETTLEIRKNKPVKKLIQSEIIGVKLGIR